ncbi:MAG: hypothetical protein KBH45_20820, partial [Verrucomicrobia bacterium]|nr:hypothetical protein [Verrucomicrobiota bacterium]
MGNALPRDGADRQVGPANPVRNLRSGLAFSSLTRAKGERRSISIGIRLLGLSKTQSYLPWVWACDLL